MNIPFFPIVVALSALTLTATAGLRPGDTAPNFSEKAADGKTYALADYKGKYVVLEWTNYGCPFVRKHYESGNMQKHQQQVAASGDVWLSICSAAPGKGGQVSAEQWLAAAKKNGSKATAVLLDSDGSTGKAYGAKTTPHVMVINPEGKLIYTGAVDSIPSIKTDDVKTAENYIAAALASAKAGKPIKTAASKPYGCGIKYKK